MTSDVINKILTKKFGEGMITSGKDLLDRKRLVIPVSPALDIALGGGIQEGTWNIISGPPKCGKTTSVLQFMANAQKPEYGAKDTWYINVEGRIDKRNMVGVQGLDPDKVHIIGSTLDRIYSAEELLTATADIIRNEKDIIVVIDSLSALCSDSELSADISGQTRNLGPKNLAAFCRQLATIVPIQNAIVIGIQHLITNTSGYGAGKMEDGGEKIKYQSDTKIRCKYTEKWVEGDKQIGQKIHWDIIWSALGPPGTEAQSYLRYGIGLDKVTELINIATDFGLISVAGAWYNCDYLINSTDKAVLKYLKDNDLVPEKGFKRQGQAKLYAFLMEYPRFVELLQEEVNKVIKV